MAQDATQDTFGPGFAATRVIRMWEPPEEVVIPYALALSPDLDFDDYGVLIRLLLRDPKQPSSILGLLDEFRTGGWTLSERDLRKIMRRLKKAGHVEHKREYNPETKRPEWVFRVYRNPANNAAYVRGGVQEALQVRPIGTPCPDGEANAASDRDTLSGCAGQADRDTLSGSAPIGTPCPDRKSPNAAGQTDRDTLSGSDAPPPHPPEEEDSSSPNPLTHAKSTAQQRAEGEGFSPEQTRNAEVFLQQMTTWQAGAATARKCAPLLLRAMRDQGWPQIADMDDAQQQLLEADIFKNTGGADSWVKCLPNWVRDLRLYSAVQATVAAPARRRFIGSGL
jgi:hypothetical protein